MEESWRHVNDVKLAQPFLLAAIEIVIYFMDKTGINLTVEDGQHATAGELFEMVMDEMKFPHEAREAFSLWLVSDLLGKCLPVCVLVLDVNISSGYLSLLLTHSEGITVPEKDVLFDKIIQSQKMSQAKNKRQTNNQTNKRD